MRTCLICFKGVRLIFFVTFLFNTQKNLAKYKSKFLGGISSTLLFSPTIHELSLGQNLFLLLFFLLSMNSNVCFNDQPIYISCHYVPALCLKSKRRFVNDSSVVSAAILNRLQNESTPMLKFCFHS